MRLTYLKIEESITPASMDYSVKERELTGRVEFEGKTGKMVLPLNQVDIRDIQELLLVKTKVLAGEA